MVLHNFITYAWNQHTVIHSTIFIQLHVLKRVSKEMKYNFTHMYVNVKDSQCPQQIMQHPVQCCIMLHYHKLHVSLKHQNVAIAITTYTNVTWAMHRGNQFLQAAKPCQCYRTLQKSEGKCSIQIAQLEKKTYNMSGFRQSVIHAFSHTIISHTAHCSASGSKITHSTIHIFRSHGGKRLK